MAKMTILKKSEKAYARMRMSFFVCRAWCKTDEVTERVTLNRRLYHLSFKPWSCHHAGIINNSCYRYDEQNPFFFAKVVYYFVRFASFIHIPHLPCYKKAVPSHVESHCGFPSWSKIILSPAFM